jgi:hypothetical protein
VQLGNGNLAVDDLGAAPAALVVESHPAALAFAVVPVLVELEVDEQAVRFETFRMLLSCEFFSSKSVVALWPVSE